MKTWLRIITLSFLTLLAVGLGITYIQKLRADAHREAVRESLRQLGQFALTTRTDGAKQRNKRELIPAATIANAALPPDQRLSWVVEALPQLDQRRQNSEELLLQIQPTLAWNADAHQNVSRIPIRLLLCPANAPELAANQPAVTQIVGITGLGDDAGRAPLDSPNAGAFHYDHRTPLSAFTDGLSQTLMFAETNRELGPWLQGGPSTARGVDMRSETAFGTRFGGVHVGGAFMSYADGRASWIGEKIAPAIFRSLATRAGGTQELADVID